MKIVQLSIENVMKISAAKIVPKDNLIEITGENGAGKSSILDSIVMALAGGNSIPEIPVRKGAEKGKIVVNCGDYTIIRSFTKDNSYLKIEAADGKQVKSPQKFLDDLIGSVSFDPLDFINNHNSADQRNILLQLIGVDVDSLDNQESQIRADRTEIGRDVKRTEQLFRSLMFYEDVRGKKEQNVSDLSTQLSNAISHNQKFDSEWAENERKKDAGARLREQVAEIESEIERLKAKAKECESSISELKTSYKETKEALLSAPKVDISPIQEAIQSSDIVNSRIRANNEYEKAAKEAEMFKKSYDDKSAAIESISSKRKELLESATMPVPGLSFSENEILYNNIPLSQCSDGEKLMISLGISMALNPKMRVLRIKDGSLLDKKNRAIIYNQIKDKDYQLWMETVSSDRNVGIHIEEGKIVAIDGEEIENSTPSQPTKTLPSDNKNDKVIPVPQGQEQPASAPESDGTEEW